MLITCYLSDVINRAITNPALIYRSTLKRIKTQTEENIFLAARAITLLTHAYRSLEITELQHALAVRYNDTETFNDDDVVDEGAIVSACCGLIVVDKESETVRLVREYSLISMRDGILTS